MRKSERKQQQQHPDPEAMGLIGRLSSVRCRMPPGAVLCISAILVMHIGLCSCSPVLDANVDATVADADPVERPTPDTHRQHRNPGSRQRNHPPPPPPPPPLPPPSAALPPDLEGAFDATIEARRPASSATPGHSAVTVSAAAQQHHPRQRPPRTRSSGGRRPAVMSPVCPSRTEWKRLFTARDINNTVVDVFQPGPGEARRAQWFYTVSCRKQAMQSRRTCQDCCIGIDNTRFSSSCQQKQSYVMAYVRSPRQTKFHYSWILINSSCNCAIASLHDDL